MYMYYFKKNILGPNTHTHFGEKPYNFEYKLFSKAF